MLEYWYQALSSPCGIEIAVSNPEKAIAKLYSVRKEALDESLAGVSVVRPPNKPDVLWLVKNGKTSVVIKD